MLCVDFGESKCVAIALHVESIDSGIKKRSLDESQYSQGSNQLRALCAPFQPADIGSDVLCECMFPIIPIGFSTWVDVNTAAFVSDFGKRTSIVTIVASTIT